MKATTVLSKVRVSFVVYNSIRTIIKSYIPLTICIVAFGVLYKKKIAVLALYVTIEKNRNHNNNKNNNNNNSRFTL